MRYLLAVMAVAFMLAPQQKCGEQRGPYDAGPDDPPVRDASVVVREPPWGGWGGWWLTGWDGGFWLNWEGGSGGNWDPRYRDGGFPGSGTGEDTGTDVLFVVRLDRGTANLAAQEAQLVDKLGKALVGEGLRIRVGAVAAMHDGSLLWAFGKQERPPAALPNTLQSWAATAEAANAQVTCTTLGLEQLGSGIASAPLAYAWDLGGGYTTYPFAERPGAFLVVFIDPEERPADPSSTQCQFQGYSPAVALGSTDPASWLGYWPPLPRGATHFAAIFTSEQVSPESLRAACLAAGVSPTAIDFLQPSAIPFYWSLLNGVNAYAPDQMSSFDYCSVVVGSSFDGPARDFAKRWADALKASAALP